MQLSALLFVCLIGAALARPHHPTKAAKHHTTHTSRSLEDDDDHLQEQEKYKKLIELVELIKPLDVNYEKNRVENDELFTAATLREIGAENARAQGLIQSASNKMILTGRKKQLKDTQDSVESLRAQLELIKRQLQDAENALPNLEREVREAEDGATKADRLVTDALSQRTSARQQMNQVFAARRPIVEACRQLEAHRALVDEFLAEVPKTPGLVQTVINFFSREGGGPTEQEKTFVEHLTTLQSKCATVVGLHGNEREVDINQN